MEEEIKTIKNEICNTYTTIKNEITKLNLIKNIKCENEPINNIDYVNNIKELFFLLFNKYKELQRNHTMLESILKKVERDSRFYLSNYMQNKIIKDALEMKLNAYCGLEEEYENLRSRVKFNNGKFLDNDRKDNEIIILRKENSSLKKNVVSLEIKNKKKERTIEHNDAKIKELTRINQKLADKINNLENSMKDNIQNSNQRNTNNSCINLHFKNSEKSFKKYQNLQNMKKRSKIYKNIQHICSPKKKIVFIEQYKSQLTNTFKTMNSISTQDKNTNKKKMNSNKIYVLKFEPNIKVSKLQKNKSMTTLKLNDDEQKTLLIHKYKDYNKELAISKNDSKMKTRNYKIINLKARGLIPLSTKYLTKKESTLSNKVREIKHINFFSSVNNLN